MLTTRVIPLLLLSRGTLVKTRMFANPVYVGDPRNVVRIFSELEADELIVMDIHASESGSIPDYRLLEGIASEAFMPVAYGGGVNSLAIAQRVFKLGFEKVAINTAALNSPALLGEIADQVGSQAVVAAIDVRRVGDHCVVVRERGRQESGWSPEDWARRVVSAGAGEILLTCVDREGTWSGLDLALVRSVADAVDVPVVAHGGAASLDDVRQAVVEGHASAVALGSMVVFQKAGAGVLVNYPSQDEVSAALRGLDSAEFPIPRFGVAEDGPSTESQ